MKYTKHIIFLFCITLVATAGCDLVNPPKKTTKAKQMAAESVKTGNNQPLPAETLARVGDWT
ncbi:MAG: hypothetical protein V2A70_01545, partial [Candidatus Omnitrophota bacterium]